MSPGATRPRPFTVIGGFLGAGKTTLVNRILAEARGTRYAVLVNDFGAVDVDARLIAAHDGQTLSLTNGCICCSLADGFIETMLRLMRDPGAFDHVIVEASGVARPGRIMDFARLDPELVPDAIVTLADAETLGARLADARVGEMVAAQIAEADLIVLNKTDLVAETGPAEARLRALNASAPVLPARHGDLPLEVILGTGAGGAPTPSDDRVEPHVHFHHRVLEATAPIDRAAFEDWAAALPAHVLRGKGWVGLAGSETPHLWQRVGRRAALGPGGTGETGTRIVLIGTEPVDVSWPFAGKG